MCSFNKESSFDSDGIGCRDKAKDSRCIGFIPFILNIMIIVIRSIDSIPKNKTG